MKSRSLIILLVTTFLHTSFSIRAEEIASSRSPESQAAFEKGMPAANHQDWDKAINSLWTAHELAPKDPLVLYNLGVAHSKAGHSFLAIIIFHASLAAGLKSPTVDDLPARMLKMELAEEQKIQKLFREATETAQLLDNDNEVLEFDGLWFGDSILTQQSSKQWALMDIVESMAVAGDLSGALALLESMDGDQSGEKDYLRLKYAWGLEEGYDVNGAWEIAKNISADRNSPDLLTRLCEHFLRAGDSERSAEALNLAFADAEDRRRTHDYIIESFKPNKHLLQPGSVEAWLAQYRFSFYWRDDKGKTTDECFDAEKEIIKIKNASHEGGETSHAAILDGPYTMARVAAQAGQCLFVIRTHERVAARNKKP